MTKNKKDLVEFVVLTREHPILSFGQIVYSDDIKIGPMGVLQDPKSKNFTFINSIHLFRCEDSHNYVALNFGIALNDKSDNKIETCSNIR